MAVYDTGDRANFPLADGVGLEGDGYALAATGTGNAVDLAAGTDSVVGVSFRSTYDEEDETLLTGGNADFRDGMQGAAVEFDGVVNVKCEGGTNYTPGTEVLLVDGDGTGQDGTAAVEGASNVTAGNTAVGTVFRAVDLGDEDASAVFNVPVLITGYVGTAGEGV